MGDFVANFRRPDAGINTVEGNVAGSRAASLTKKRAAEQAEFEARKRKIQADTERGKKSIDAKFDADSSLSQSEKNFRAKTVGLVTAEEFRKATEEAERERRGGRVDLYSDDDVKKKEVLLSEEDKAKAAKAQKKAKKKALKKKKAMLSTLSFAGAEDATGIVGDDDGPGGNTASKFNGDEGGSAEVPQGEIKKNPDVDTSFLPDKEREERAAAERDRLKREWLAKQREMKNEPIEITYSYWDGSGHRRTVITKKGDTVAQFLELVRKDLAKEFREMGNVSSDALLYVKEDLIIPQDITFYDLIATRARGKSGPLFNFDVHDDIRLGTVDVRVEKDESHPGKVVERRWYDRNKHIFPASRWEVFDPAKDYGSYTIHGGEVNKKKK